ncbi:calcium permeable stress-gated cation channel [Pancytospora philotis]|nr:calcium permeable stress-gated cation channel [Pancytospora philotis]
MTDVNKEGVKVMNKLLKGSDFKKADTEIISNGMLQAGGAFALMLVYLVCRRRAPWLYYPNVRNTPSHPAYRCGDGVFAWVRPLIGMDDSQLLGLVGLDGFMFLQTIKLLYRICLLLSLTVVPALCYCFYVSKAGTDGLFSRLSIHEIREHRLFLLITVLVYIVTMLVYYFIFIYYKRFVALRQLYLTSPATMTSIAKLKELTRSLPPDTSAVDYVDVKSRTVLMNRLPAGLATDRDGLRYMRGIGIGEVESVVLVRDTMELQRLYGLRNTAVQDIEKETDRVFERMCKYYKTENALIRCSFGDDQADLVHAAMEQPERKLAVDEKAALLNRFVEHADAFMQRVGEHSSLKQRIAKFKELQDAIDEEKRHLENVYKTEEEPGEADAEHPPTAESLRDTNVLDKSVDTVVSLDDSLFVPANLRKDVSFFSLDQLVHWRKNRAMFTLDLPIGKKKAFVTFKDKKTTGIVMQSKIGSRVFACDALTAPAPYDIIWSNIVKNEAFCYIMKIFSSICFFLMYGLFYYFFAMITTFLDIDSDSPNVVIRFIVQHEFIHSLYRGFLVPFVYNILLFFIPIIMAALLNTQGIYAYSMFQIELMNAFSIFLFFNGFLAIFCAKVFFTGIPDVYHQRSTVKEVIASLGTSIVESSIFFFNAIIQRLCIGSAIVFLKPGPFIFNFMIAPFIHKNRRQAKEIEFAPPVDLGNAIPNILLIFPMVIAYSAISPVILVLGYLFYTVSYFTYKNELVYAAKNECESGGIFWKYSIRFIVYSICIFHLATAIKIFVEGYAGVALGLFPLILINYLYYTGLKSMFERSCDYPPIAKVEEEYLDDFAQQALQDRSELLAKWVMNVENADEDTLEVSSIQAEAVQSKGSSLYRDPAMSSSLSTFIFPQHFYSVLSYIADKDKDDLYALK